MIGIYDSFLSGDIHEKSDLDLLVLINDDRGWQLGCTFIQDDLQIGHDIYCTTWDSLRRDALYQYPNISKLMDSKIVYCADEKYKHDLEALRTQAKDIVSAPLFLGDFLKAEKLLKEAERCYTMAMICEEKSEMLDWAANVIYYVENAVAMLNKLCLCLPRFARVSHHLYYHFTTFERFHPKPQNDRISRAVSVMEAALVFCQVISNY